MSEIARRDVLKWFSAAALGVTVSGCGLSSGGAIPLPVRPGSIKPVPELQGARLTVGSKDFTEQILLGYLAEFALSAAGAEVRDMTNITGSLSARNALISEQIDMMWDYTGSSWISYNGMSQPIPDPVKQFEAVRELDQKRHGITWTALAVGVDNTYAFAVNQQNAKRFGVSTISDMAELARKQPDQATFCLDSEFANRNDGMPGVMQSYDFTVPKSHIQKLGTGPIYQATADGKSCNFGVVFLTDGRVRSLNLEILEDDKQFFPRYNPALVLRQDTLRKYPQISDVFRPIAQRLTNDEMMKINGQVDVDGGDPAEVARNWLVEHAFVTMPG